MKQKLLSFLIPLLFFSCASKKIRGIEYTLDEQPSINVFVPRDKTLEPAPVLIFVHGGNWDSGSKGMYGFIGRNFAKKGIITVIPGYTLSPEANYDGMAQEIAQAIEWTKNNIASYGGDSTKLFLTGHSAGGHLVALAAMNPKYGIDPKDVSGIILNDAAGLDMHHYLTNNPPTKEDHYNTTWSENPETWRKASPITFISENTPDIKIYLGSKTYTSITKSNKRFLKELNDFQPNVKPTVLPKSHIGMITQYLWPWNDRYDEILSFINSK